MARAGQSYTITLKKAHLEWGTHRYTNSRGVVYGEGYIPIPAKVARTFNIQNQNGTGYNDVLGVNLFNCKSVDGIFDGVVRAQGCKEAGYIYAKQFSGDGDLKAIGDWFYAIGASVGDRVKVYWTSPADIVIEKL
jgi:hypothetical protein